MCLKFYHRTCNVECMVKWYDKIKKKLKIKKVGFSVSK